MEAKTCAANAVLTTLSDSNFIIRQLFKDSY